MSEWWLGLWDNIEFTTAFWTIATAICCTVSCALLGCYLVLRRMSMIGDAISHAILPGLVLAFLWTGSRNPLPMIGGAMVLGVLTAVLTQTLTQIGRVPTDSSMGVVFTSLFALGVILITVYASQIDLDPGCVLYGLIEFVVLDTVPVGAVEVPRALLILAGVLLAVLLFIGVLWKELKLSSFDPALATAMGLSAGFVHYALMAMVATVTVTSFEAVGAILVIAMLIAPGATAHLLTDRLLPMMLVAVVLAVISSVGGYWLALVWNTSIAGMIAVIAGGMFILATLLAPRYGVVGRVWRNLELGLRIAREDMLAHLWRRREAAGGDAAHPEELTRQAGGGLLARLALRRLRGSSMVATRGGALALTDAGAEEALRLVRAHRLWETYFTEVMDRDPEEAHEHAEQVEHFIAPHVAEQLAEQLSEPQQDPHGREIPRPDGEADGSGGAAAGKPPTA